MRYKACPEPVDDLECLRSVAAAVPEEADAEASCCARLVESTDLPDEDEAADWLVFLRALGLAEETDGGRFRRSPGSRHAPSADRLAESFRDRVYLADEVLAALEGADRLVDAGVVLGRIRPHIPPGRRTAGPGSGGPDTEADVDAAWREHVGRLLEWAVVLGLATRLDGGYVSTDVDAPEGR